MTNPSESGEITANALTKKRADLIFELRQHEQAIEQLQTQLVHVDAVLRMFRPDFLGETARVRLRRSTKSPYFRHGELTQRIYAALRTAETSTSAEIAAQAMRDKGLDPNSDPTTRTDFVRRVGLQLNTLQRKGKIERLGKGSALRWRAISDI